MSDNVFVLALIGALLLIISTLIIGVVVNPRKGVAGWIMTAGSIFLLVGFAGLSATAIEEMYDLMLIDQWRYTSDVLWDVTFITLTGGAMVFTTGFVWDRINRGRTA